MESLGQRGDDPSEAADGVRYGAGRPLGAVARIAVGATLAVVMAVALWPFAKDAQSEAREARPGELEAAVGAIRAEFRGGDAVRVEPSWWVLPWRALTRMGDGTQRWPFEGLLLSEDLDPVEALGHERLLLLSGFGREPALPPELEGAGRLERELWRGETTHATVWDLEKVPRLRTLTREWERLEVLRRFGPGEPESRCPFKNGKLRCGRESWLDVALEPRVVWRREVNWLFVHPGPVGTALEVRWRDLERQANGAPTWVYLRVGPSLDAVRHQEGKAVRVTVLVDGVERDRFELGPHRFWMERRAVRIPPGAGPATVAFRIECDDNAWRETMLEADLMGEPGPALRRWATQVVQ